MSAVENQPTGQDNTPPTDGPKEIVFGATAPKTDSAPDVTDVEVKTETTTEQIEKSDDTTTVDENRRPRQKGKGLQERIDELTRSRHEAEREAAYWRARATGTDSAQSPAQPAATSKPPVATDFATQEEYIEALAEYKVDQKLAKKEVEQKEVKQLTDRVTSWQSRLESARTELSDFNEVMDSAEVPVAPHVTELLLEHEQGAKLAYHFAKNPEALEKINSMSPVKAAFELAVIATKLAPSAPADTATETVVEKPTSKAPVPPKPIGQGRATTPALGEMDMDSYIANRKRQGASWAR